MAERHSAQHEEVARRHLRRRGHLLPVTLERRRACPREDVVEPAAEERVVVLLRRSGTPDGDVLPGEERAITGDVAAIREGLAGDGAVGDVALSATVAPLGVEPDDRVGTLLEVLRADVDVGHRHDPGMAAAVVELVASVVDDRRAFGLERERAQELGEAPSRHVDAREACRRRTEAPVETIHRCTGARPPRIDGRDGRERRRDVGRRRRRRRRRGRVRRLARGARRRVRRCGGGRLRRLVPGLGPAAGREERDQEKGAKAHGEAPHSTRSTSIRPNGSRVRECVLRRVHAEPSFEVRDP